MNSKDEAQQAEELLRRIGWHRSNWKQIEVYARMEPWRKVEQVLHMRDEGVRLLEERLRHEHPDCTPRQIERIVIEHLELLREV
jgi:hypothetical protein